MSTRRPDRSAGIIDLWRRHGRDGARPAEDALSWLAIACEVDGTMPPLTMAERGRVLTAIIADLAALPAGPPAQ